MIIGKVTGDEAVVLRLRVMGDRIRERLSKELTRSAIALTRYVKERKLSGQVLKNRTGTLRRKINYRTTETEKAMTASVGVKLSYAAAHEYGFDGIVTVREHLRQVKQAFGRPIAPVTATVHAHQRHMHLPERSFLRSSLRENAPAIRERLRAAVIGAIQ